MNCLAIDTANTRLTAVLMKGGEVFYREIEVGKSGHSSLLMPTVDGLMKEGGVRPCELDAVAAAVGPGSFTGIRIGVSAVTAIAFATGARRVAVTSFELIAYNRQSVLAAVDAGHGNVYAAECEGGKVVSTRFIEAAEAADSGIEKAVYSSVCSCHEALAGVVAKKLADGDFCDVLVPFYMRKTQAERERDEV